MSINFRTMILVFIGLSVVSFPKHALAVDGIKIMPFGDSITVGETLLMSALDKTVGQTCVPITELIETNLVTTHHENNQGAPYTGYRKILKDKLDTNSYLVDFVGSVFDGPTKETGSTHEAICGRPVNVYGYPTDDDRVKELPDTRKQFENSLDVNAPEVILFHLGTNDSSRASHKHSDVEDAIHAVRTTLAIIFERIPSATVVIAKITLAEEFDESVNSNYYKDKDRKYIDSTLEQRSDWIEQYNKQLDGVVVNFTERGYAISAVDMQDTYNEYVDGLHPVETAYQNIADEWFESLDTGILIKPATSTSPDESGKSLLGENGVLDTLYGLENLERVSDGVDKVWTNAGSETGGSVTAKATYTKVDIIVDPPQLGRKFGYIRDGKFNPLFELKTAQALNSDGIATAPLPIFNISPSFIWAIDPDFRSDPTKNPLSADHMKTWRIERKTNRPNNTIGNYVLAWEDFNFDKVKDEPGQDVTNDRDFQDLVVEVSKVEPAKQTPISAASASDQPNLTGGDGLVKMLVGDEIYSRVPDDWDQYFVNTSGGGVSAIVTAEIGDTAIATLGDAGGAATAEAKGHYNAISQTLQYIDGGNKVHDVFTQDGFGQSVLMSGVLPPKTELPIFRWGLSPDSASTSFDSQPAGNTDGRDHMVTFKILSGPREGNYLIAWDDHEGREFQDLVVEVSNVIPARQVNGKVVQMPLTRDNIKFEQTAVTGGPKGKFTISATFTNDSAAAINNPFFGVVVLSGGNQLLNAAEGPGGVGATLQANVGSDNVLSPGESMTVKFKIGLQKVKRFTFFVDLFEGAGP